MQAKRFAAIDIGTVTCRLLVADVDDTGLRELYRHAAITNLGEGVDATGVLSEAAIERTSAQVAQYMQVVSEYTLPNAGVRIIASATSASRDAKNSAVFAEKLARLGVQLAVIPGQREAQLSFLGASADFAGKQILVADVGGGSTELIAGMGGRAPLQMHSFDIGCRRVTERFLVGDPATPAQIKSAHEWAMPQFKTYFDELSQRGFTIDRMVAVAGTATSVVSIDKEMEVYDSARVHGSVVTREALQRVTERLEALSVEQRKHVVGLQPGRAPVIVAGMYILDDLLQLAKLDSFTVSESDILQGMIMDAAQQN